MASLSSTVRTLMMLLFVGEPRNASHRVESLKAVESDMTHLVSRPDLEIEPGPAESIRKMRQRKLPRPRLLGNNRDRTAQQRPLIRIQHLRGVDDYRNIRREGVLFQPVEDLES